MDVKKNSMKTHHFRDEMSKYVIIHHNSKIIKRITQSLDNVEEVYNKNYDVLRGDYKKTPITLIATGMGAGNTGIVVDQVINQGAKYIFKLGTFGALQEEIKIGDICIPIGAVRSEGLTDAYAPIYYPACADPQLYNEVLLNSKNSNILIQHYGIIHSVNIYSQYYENPYNLEKYSSQTYSQLSVLGVEMETSTAFICSSVKKAKCVAILICNRDIKTQRAYEQGEEVNWDKHQNEKQKNIATSDSIQLILKTINSIEEKDDNSG